MAQATPLPSTLESVRFHPAPNEIRLDDPTWQSRQKEWRRGRWYVLGIWAGLAGLVSGSIWIRHPGLFAWTLLGLGGTGAVVLLIAFVFYPADPDTMSIKEGGIVFHRPSGGRFALPLKKGVTVKLLDQSHYLERRKHRWGTFPNYLLNHSSTTETISLTGEAFQAVESELRRREAVLVKQHELPLMPGSRVSVYRL